MSVPRRPDRRPSAGTPRWVVAFGIAAAVLVAAFIVLHLTGNGMGGHSINATGMVVATVAPW